jgi:hypothetical protein
VNAPLVSLQSRENIIVLTIIFSLVKTKEVKVKGGKAPYAGNALKVMPIVPSPATFYDRERP